MKILIYGSRGWIGKQVTNYLDTKKLEELYPNVRNIKDAVRDCLIKYKTTYIPKNNVIFGHYLSYKNLNYQDFIKRLYKKASILNSERFINKI